MTGGPAAMPFAGIWPAILQTWQSVDPGLVAKTIRHAQCGKTALAKDW